MYGESGSGIYEAWPGGAGAARIYEVLPRPSSRRNSSLVDPPRFATIRFGHFLFLESLQNAHCIPRKSYTLPSGVCSPVEAPRELQEFKTFGEVVRGPEGEETRPPESDYMALKRLAPSERPRPSSLFVSKRSLMRGIFQPSPTIPGSLPTTPSQPGSCRSASAPFLNPPPLPPSKVTAEGLQA